MDIEAKPCLICRRPTRSVDLVCDRHKMGGLRCVLCGNTVGRSDVMIAVDAKAMKYVNGTPNAHQQCAEDCAY